MRRSGPTRKKSVQPLSSKPAGMGHLEPWLKKADVGHNEPMLWQPDCNRSKRTVERKQPAVHAHANLASHNCTHPAARGRPPRWCGH